MHEGVEFDVQIVPDTLSLRKLPALWVLVSVPGPLPTLNKFEGVKVEVIQQGDIIRLILPKKMAL